MMRFIFPILCFCFIHTNGLYSQNGNHPTISDFTIGLRSVSSGTIMVDNKAAFKVIPEVIVKLKPADVKRILFKISKNNIVLSTQSVSLDSIPVSCGNQSLNTFYRDNKGYHLLASDTLILGKYTYEVKTEDSMGNLSPSFIKEK